MAVSLSPEVREIMDMRFGCDSLIALATVDENRPSVRAVNAYYENGSFYVITDVRSNKMSQLGQNPNAAICGDWFTAHGTGENLGWIDDPANAETARKLKRIFSEWYDNGHIDEENRNTVILRIRLMDGILFHHGERYEIDFSECV